MLDAREYRAVRCAIARQLIRDQHAWHACKSREQLPEEPRGGALVPPGLGEDSEEVPRLIDGAPQGVVRPLLALNTAARGHVSPGRGRRRRRPFAAGWSDFRHRWRIVSYVTTMPRSASRSSPSR